MSQAALAAAMREYGWKWSQPTVAAIEKGERGLKLAEAEALVAILRLENVEELLDRPIDTLIFNARERMTREGEAIMAAARRFYDAQLSLARVLDEATERHGMPFEPDDGSEWKYQLQATPGGGIKYVAPTQRLIPEDLDESVGPWTRLLAEAAYGTASREGVFGAETAYPAE